MGILELLLKITADSSDARADLDKLRTTQGALVASLTGSLAAGLNATSVSFSRTSQQTAEGTKQTERYTTRVRSAEAAQRELARTQGEAALQALRLGAAQARSSAQQQQAALQLGVAQARAARQLDVIAAAQERAASKNFLSHLRQGANAARDLGQGLASLGRTLTVSLTAPLVAAGAGILTVGIQYQNSLNLLQATTHATADEMEAARGQAKALGADLTLPATSAADAAEAMTELAKGGLSISEAMAAARGTLQLATAAQVDGAKAAEIQAAALNQFRLSGDKAGVVADLLANAASAASGEITDMANALSYVGPVAASMKIGITDTATAVALLAKNGILSEKAGTALRGMLASLAEPSKKARAALEVLGVQAFDQQGRFVGLRAITEQLSESKKRLSVQEYNAAAAAAFGREPLAAINALAASGVQDWDAMAAAVSREGGAAELAAARTKGLAGAWEALKSQLETLAITVFEAIEAPLTQAVQLVSTFVEKVVNGFNALPQAGQQAIIILASIVAAIGPVLLFIGTLIAGVSSIVLAVIGAAAAVGGFIILLKVVVIVIAALAAAFLYLIPIVLLAAAAVVVIYQAWQRNIGGIRELVFSAFGAIKTFLAQVWAEVRTQVLRVLPEIQATIKAFVDNVGSFWNTHGRFIVAVIQQAWAIIKTVVITTIRLVGDVITFFARLLRSDWGGAWDVAVTIISRAVVAIVEIGTRLYVTINAILARIMVQLVIWAAQLYQAGVNAAIRLFAGFVYYTQGPGLASAVAAVLMVAYALSSPTTLAAFAYAGYQQAKARADAYAAVQQPDASAPEPQGQGVVRLNPDGSLKRDVPAGEQTNLGTGTDTNFGGGGRGRKPKKDKTEEENAKGRVEAAQAEVDTAQRAYETEVAAAERAYDRRLAGLLAYVSRAKAAEDQRLQAVLNGIQAEKNELDKTESNAVQREAKRKVLDEKEAAARAEATARKQALDDKAEDAEIDSLTAHQESLLRQADTFDKRRIDAYRAAADRRSISAEAAENKIIEIERAAFQRRAAALNAEMILAGENQAAQQAVTDKREELEAERAAFEEDATRRTIAAREADLAHQRAANRERQQMQDDLQAQALAVGQLDIERMERERVNSDEIARARRDHAIATAELERRQALRRLQEEKDEALERVKGLADELARKKEINDLYRERELLSEEEFQRRKKEIEDRYKHEKEDDDSILGPIDEAIGKIGDYGDAAEVLGNRIAATFLGIQQAVGESVKAWVLYSKTQGAIIRRVLAEQLAALAQEAAMQGIKQTALALAALAIGNFGAAAKHGLSAAAWFALAGGSALLGRKVAGDLFNQGSNAAGGTGAGSAASGGSDTGQPEKVIIEQGRNQLTQTIILRVESNDSHIVSVAARDITTMNGPLRQAVVQVVEG